MKKRFYSVISFSQAQNRSTLKSIIFLLILGLLLNGCYTNKSVIGRRNSGGYLTELNDSVSQKTAQVELVNGEIFTGKAVHVTKDSTFWWDAKTESTRYSVATSETKSIATQKRNTLKGLGYGLLIGAALGASLTQLGDEDVYDCSDAEGLCFTRSEAAIVGIVLFSPPSGLLGLILGAATKTTESFEFQQSETEP